MSRYSVGAIEAAQKAMSLLVATDWIEVATSDMTELGQAFIDALPYGWELVKYTWVPRTPPDEPATLNCP
jgi:hypothetical protein